MGREIYFTTEVFATPLYSKIGTVPSGKTVEGQISDLTKETNSNTFTKTSDITGNCSVNFRKKGTVAMISYTFDSPALTNWQRLKIGSFADAFGALWGSNGTPHISRVTTYYPVYVEYDKSDNSIYFSNASGTAVPALQQVAGTLFVLCG